MKATAKRTTLILQSTRFVDLKQLAAERGQTLSAVVDEFLAEGIRRARTKKAAPPPLPGPFDCGEALIDINDREALDRLLDEDRAISYRY